jgi:hypothetical protein
MGELLYGNAIHIRKQAEIDAGRITKASGNEKRGAISDLQRFSQSLSNSRTLDAGGKNIGAITENISRSLDAATFGTFMGRVQAAEELGALTAQVAVAGAGGSSVESYEGTVRLSQAMQEEQASRRVNSENISASNQRGDILTDTVDSLGNDVILADQDYTQFVDHKKMSTFDRIATIGMAAGAFMAGGPQASMAVIGMAESQQAANNGDFAGAQSAAFGAIQNGISAFKTSHKMAGGPVTPGSGVKFKT